MNFSLMTFDCLQSHISTYKNLTLILPLLRIANMQEPLKNTISELKSITLLICRLSMQCNHH